MSATQTVYSATVQVLPLAKELDKNKVTPGVLGFLVFAVIGVAVWVLMKSMSRHMNRVDFDEEPPQPPSDGAGDNAPHEPGDSAPGEGGDSGDPPSAEATAAPAADGQSAQQSKSPSDT